MNAKASTTAKEALRGGRSRLARSVWPSCWRPACSPCPRRPPRWRTLRPGVASTSPVVTIWRPARPWTTTPAGARGRLLEDHIKSPGWCLFNQGKNGQTSARYITGGGLSSAYNMRPDFLTLQLGEQNATIVKLITDCFDKVRTTTSPARASAREILGNSSVWTNLKNNYTTILQQTRIMACAAAATRRRGRQLPEPVPAGHSTSSTRSRTLCVPLIDTIPTCTVRWAQFPPALLALDQVFQKLNQTLKDAMAPFQAGPNGSRWVYVEPTRSSRTTA